MHDGGIYTVKTKLDYNLVYRLRNIRLESKEEDKYFFNENQVKKFVFLKAAKKSQRVKPNGKSYYYTELKAQCYSLITWMHQLELCLQVRVK